MLVFFPLSILLLASFFFGRVSDAVYARGGRVLVLLVLLASVWEVFSPAHTFLQYSITFPWGSEVLSWKATLWSQVLLLLAAVGLVFLSFGVQDRQRGLFPQAASILLGFAFVVTAQCLMSLLWAMAAILVFGYIMASTFAPRMKSYVGRLLSNGRGTMFALLAAYILSISHKWPLVFGQTLSSDARLVVWILLVGTIIRLGTVLLTPAVFSTTRGLSLPRLFYWEWIQSLLTIHLFHLVFQTGLWLPGMWVVLLVYGGELFL